MSGPQGWAELPDDLLCSIAALLSSCRDLLAFSATCPSWRASSLSAKSTLSTHFPPLLIECSFAQMDTADSNVQHTWNFTDLANPNSSFHRPSPQNILDNASFLGCSYGHAIFTSGTRYFIVDVFTGAKVSPPLFPFFNLTWLKCLYGGTGTLTAPIASPGSHLLVCTITCMLAWRVGSDSWLQYHFPLSNKAMWIEEVVSFKGQLFGRFATRLYTVRLEPQLSIQELAVVWEDNMAEPILCDPDPWLVVCGDMLLLIGSRTLEVTSGFEAFWLDLSAEPARWVKVKKLDKWAVFVGFDDRSQPLSCKNPEKWGGRSNTIYCTDPVEGWTAHSLTGAPNDDDDMSALSVRGKHRDKGLRRSWVFPPSMLSSND